MQLGSVATPFQQKLDAASRQISLGMMAIEPNDPRNLDLVTRGVLWATGHINEDGTPAKGYGPGGK